jgi:hypothetical protein
MDLSGLTDEKRFFPMLARLQECLCKELAEAGGPSLCYCGLMVGTSPPPFGLMDCSKGDCGVAWVRPMLAYPSTAFPAQDADGGNQRACAGPLAMQVEAGVARCAPRAQGRSAQPDPQDVFDAARLYMSDMAAVRRAIACCFGKDRDVQFSMGQWSPLAVSAGSAGGYWTFWIG